MKQSSFHIVVMLLVLFPLMAVAVAPSAGLSSSFGYVNIGESTKTTFGGIFVSNFTSPSDLGNITQLTAYLASGGTSVKAVIYSDKNGVPNTLLAEGNLQTLEGTSGKWITFDIEYHGKPKTTYWLGFLSTAASTVYYSANVSGKAIYSSPVSETPSTFVEATASHDEVLSIYATYLASSSVAPTPSNENLGHSVLLLTAVAGLILAAIIAVVISAKRRRKA